MACIRDNVSLGSAHTVLAGGSGASRRPVVATRRGRKAYKTGCKLGAFIESNFLEGSLGDLAFDIWDRWRTGDDRWKPDPEFDWS